MLVKEIYHASGKVNPDDGITFIPGLPEFTDDDYVYQYRELYTEQGRELARVLWENLPGGTFDSLLCHLLDYKRSLFRVTLGDEG